MKKYLLFLMATLMSVFAYADATIHVDASGKAKATDRSYNTYELEEGDNTVPAGDYMVVPFDANYCLKSVVKGDEVIAETYGYYMVELADGDNLNITAQWLDEEGEQAVSSITFNDAEAIASVTYAGVDITEQGVAGGDELEAAGVTYVVGQGGKVIITLNEGYETTCATSFYATEDVYEFTTTKKAALATVTVDNANKVKMINKNYEQLTLVNGSQKFLAGQYMITPAIANGLLNKVELNDREVAAPYGYYAVELAENDVLKITADFDVDGFGLTISNAAAVDSIVCNGQQIEVTSMGLEGESQAFLPAGYNSFVYVNAMYQAALDGKKQSQNIITVAGNKDHELTILDELTFRVDDPTAVTLMNENRETIALTDGANTIKCGNYILYSAKPAYMLNSVKVNGYSVAPVTGAAYWEMPLAAGSKVEVTANYEEEDYGISFNDVAAIKSVTSMYNGGTELEIMTGGEGETLFASTAAPAGYMVNVVLNEGYTSESALNFYATQDVSVETTKLALATVKIDNAAKVAVENENREQVALIAGAQKWVAGTYNIKSSQAAGDYRFASVKLNGEEVAPASKGATYWMVELAENDILDITADYADEVFAVTFNDAAAIKSVTSNGQEVELMTGGEGETAFAQAAVLPGYKVVVTLYDGFTTESDLVFYATQDTEVVTAQVVDVHATINIADVDLATVHMGGSPYGTEVELVEGENAVTVKSNNNQLYVVPNTGKTVFVSVNDETVVANEYGHFLVEVTEGAVIVITDQDPTSINSVTADYANGTIFNLNGQRINKANVKGIVIVNGKKVATK